MTDRCIQRERDRQMRDLRARQATDRHARQATARSVRWEIVPSEPAAAEIVRREDMATDLRDRMVTEMADLRGKIITIRRIVRVITRIIAIIPVIIKAAEMAERMVRIVSKTEETD